MSELVVFTYEQPEKAAEALAAVATLKQDNVQKMAVGIEDAAVVVKNEKGKVKVQQTLETIVKGSGIVSGGLWGVLIGFLFGGPIFGALLGMGLTGLLGRKIDIGIDNEFIKRIGDDLEPGHSALFLLVNDTPVETIADALKNHGGTLYHTSFSDEAATALAQVGEQDELKAAIAQDNE